MAAQRLAAAGSAAPAASASGSSAPASAAAGAPATRPPSLAMTATIALLVSVVWIMCRESGSGYPEAVIRAQSLVTRDSRSSSGSRGDAALLLAQASEAMAVTSSSASDPDEPPSSPSPAEAAALAFRPSCNFSIATVDPECPRFVRKQPTTWVGLGDRFIQWMVQVNFALDAKAVPLPMERDYLKAEGMHGSYDWAYDFISLRDHLPFKDHASVYAAYPNLTLIKPAEEGDYAARVKSVEGQCNVLIEVDINVCGGLCYYGSKPRFQRLKDVLACDVMRARERGDFPPLVFDKGAGAEDDEYVVAIHVRLGDVVLHGDEASGTPYFTKVKRQVDEILQDFPAVHYYFIAEAPELAEHEPPLPFLDKIFGGQEQEQEQGGRRTKVTYLNHLDSYSSTWHMMNADMLVTSGSSFPYFAATVSPKPVVLMAQGKEGAFYPSYLRDDLVLLNNDGDLATQTVGEVTALVAVRYQEVHGKPFPYRRRGRRQLRRG